MFICKITIRRAKGCRWQRRKLWPGLRRITRTSIRMNGGLATTIGWAFRQRKNSRRREMSNCRKRVSLKTTNTTSTSSFKGLQKAFGTDIYPNWWSLSPGRRIVHVRRINTVFLTLSSLHLWLGRYHTLHFLSEFFPVSRYWPWDQVCTRKTRWLLSSITLEICWKRIEDLHYHQRCQGLGRIQQQDVS